MRMAGGLGENQFIPSTERRSRGRGRKETTVSFSDWFLVKTNLFIPTLCWVFTRILGVEDCVKCSTHIIHLIFTTVPTQCIREEKIVLRNGSKWPKVTAIRDWNQDLLIPEPPLALGGLDQECSWRSIAVTSSLHILYVYAKVSPCDNLSPRNLSLASY